MGNQGIADMLAPALGNGGAIVVQRKDEGTLLTTKQENEHAFIREVLEGLIADEFEFPKRGSSGAGPATGGPG